MRKLAFVLAIHPSDCASHSCANAGIVFARCRAARRVYPQPVAWRAFSDYDATGKQWRAEPGEYEILVECSSAQIEWRGKVTLSGAAAASNEFAFPTDGKE